MSLIKELWAYSPVEVAVYGSIVVMAGAVLGLIVVALAHGMDGDVLEDAK